MQLLMEKIKDLSVVKLRDGREGTVLSVFDYPDKPLAYLVDFSIDDMDMETILHVDVESVTWE